MNKKLYTVILAGVIMSLVAMPALSFAGKGKSNCLRVNSQTRTKATKQIHVRQQTNNGTSATAGVTTTGTAQKKGNTYGPGDGTGNMGSRPLDGTGYGAPANR